MQKIVFWLTILVMPIFLGFSVITLVIHPAYPRYEYAKPNFPPDPFGFTQEERLAMALISVAYLESWAAPEEVIHLLSDQRLPGSDQPLYNAREIQHMLDVKRVTDAIRIGALAAGGVASSGLTWLLAAPARRRTGYRAIWWGGLLTVIILVAIAGFILLAWPIFFVQFHELLFPPDTWTFNLSDALIRLHPEKFFFDVGVIMSVGTLLVGLATAGLGYGLSRRAGGRLGNE